MRSLYIPCRAGKMHCLRFGHGPRLLLALHGFGDRARMFVALEPALANHYTIYAVDWPYHGQTEWPYDHFKKSDLLAVVRSILEKEGMERLSLMGFSFGARLAQAMLPDLIEQLDKLYLLSPDGIKTKGMSTAVRTPLWLRKAMFKYLQNPAWFIKIVRFGKTIRIVPPMIGYFLEANLSRPDRFRRTFGCWLSLNEFYLRRRRIRAILQESMLPVSVYFGQQDDMIRFKTVKKMHDRIPNMQLFLINEKHRVIGPALNEKLREELGG